MRQGAGPGFRPCGRGGGPASRARLRRPRGGAAAPESSLEVSVMSSRPDTFTPALNNLIRLCETIQRGHRSQQNLLPAPAEDVFIHDSDV